MVPLVLRLPRNLRPWESTWLTGPLRILDQFIKDTIPLGCPCGLADTLESIFRRCLVPVIARLGLGTALTFAALAAAFPLPLGLRVVAALIKEGESTTIRTEISSSI